MITTSARSAPSRVVVASLLTALVVMVATVLPAIGAVKDGADAGRWLPGAVGSQEDTGRGFWLGAYEAPGNTETNYPAWCIHMWRANPQPRHTATIATLSSAESWAPSDLRMTVPQTAWVLNQYQSSTEANTRAALSYLMHANYEQPDPETGHPDAQASVTALVQEVKRQMPEVHSLAAKFVSAARASAVSGYEAGAVEGEGKRTGNIHGIGVLSEAGWLAGTPITVTLNGPAKFVDTNSSTWSGKSKSEPINLAWEATGNGEVTWTLKTKNTRRTLSKYSVDGTMQDLLSYGNRPASDPEEVSTPGASFRVIYDFQPIVKSNVPDKTVSLGDVLEDVLTVEADPNYGSGEWFKVEDSDDFIPVKFEGTAYLVGDLPVDKPTDVPAEAKVIGTTSFVADGPGEYRAKLDTPASESGFVTWVWKMVKNNQVEEFIEFIHDDFSDQYGVAEETTSVWHEAEIDSALSIRETKSGTYLVDDLFVSGMPDDHPNFAGNDRFSADVKQMSQRLYFFAHGQNISDDNLEAATLIGEVSVPAANGFYPSVGSTKFKMLLDDAGNQVPGTYVFVTNFAGDDRVKAMATSVTDSKEQYVVAPNPLQVSTKAVPQITVGEKAHDTAIVTGSVPAGATLGFELYKATGTQKTCTPENRVFVSEPKTLPSAGTFDSDETVLSEAGTYYWVETVYDKDGATLHRGECGLPSETTIVKDNDGDGAGRGGGLAKTGTTAATVGGIALLAGAGGGTALYVRRKRS